MAFHLPDQETGGGAGVSLPPSSVKCIASRSKVAPLEGQSDEGTPVAGGIKMSFSLHRDERLAQRGLELTLLEASRLEHPIATANIQCDVPADSRLVAFRSLVHEIILPLKP